MNRPEAEKLLGGYAAGILTEEERRVLFSAALDHQEIFDALMDEEGLRQLLADPETRAHLLALLSPASSLRKPVPIWRRPAVLGLAASLFAIMTTGYMVWRRGESGVAQLEKTAKTEDSKLQPSAESDQAVLGASKSAAAPAEVSAPATMARSSAGSVSPAPQATSTPPGERKRSEKEAPPAPPPTAKGEQGPGPSEQQVPMARAAKPAAAPAQAEYSTSTPADLSEPSAAGAPQAPANQARALKAKKQAPAPEASLSYDKAPRFQISSSLQRLDGGKARLTVAWGPAGHLYLLKRTAAGVAVMPPLHSASGNSGAVTTTFVFTLEDKDILDLYLLANEEANPRSLPASGEVDGTWKRVFPE
jgi:hypothetical protein